MNRGSVGILVVILVLQIALFGMLAFGGGVGGGSGITSRTERLDRLSRYLLAMADGMMSVANFDMYAMSMQGREQSETTYKAARKGAVDELEKLKESYANQPEDSAMIDKAIRLTDLADKTVVNMHDSFDSPGGSRGMGRMMVMMSGMMKLNKITNALIDYSRQLLAHAGPPSDAKPVIPMALSGASMLLTLAAVAIAMKGK